MQEPECLLIKGYGMLSTAPDWPEKQVFMEDAVVSALHLFSLLSKWAWVGDELTSLGYGRAFRNFSCSKRKGESLRTDQGYKPEKENDRSLRRKQGNAL